MHTHFSRPSKRGAYIYILRGVTWLPLCIIRGFLTQPSLCYIKREKGCDSIFTCGAKYVLNLCSARYFTQFPLSFYKRKKKKDYLKHTTCTWVRIRSCPRWDELSPSFIYSVIKISLLLYLYFFFFFYCHTPQFTGLSDYLKSLYGWIIQKPADFTRSLSCSTALSLPSILRENLLTPGWSIAPNCRCMKPAW